MTLAKLDDAFDLLQDAFLRAFEKLDRFQGESSFYTWVYRIAVNLALSCRRRRRVTARLGLSACILIPPLLLAVGVALFDSFVPQGSDPPPAAEQAPRDSGIHIHILGDGRASEN